LVNRILDGDSQAVIEFYNLYSPKILKYLNVKLSPEDAQEILNDVFFEAVDSLTLLRNKDNISAWLYKIAQNKTADYYRKKKIKSIILSQVPFLKIIASEISDPEFQFEKNKIRDEIEKAFLSLPMQYRKILKLHYEDNIPVKDLAPVLNLSFKAAESLLYRARQSFKTAYDSSLNSDHWL
ncbi:MAG: sigma-70 family RNA polymerase sigma factor, partial [Patescibacteria group bacterium]